MKAFPGSRVVVIAMASNRKTRDGIKGPSTRTHLPQPIIGLVARPWVKMKLLTFALGVVPLSAVSLVPVDSVSIPINSNSSNSRITVSVGVQSRISGHAAFPTRYPIGVDNPNSPSGQSPPTRTSMQGYQQSYVSDFSGNSLPEGWSAFSGAPSSDPGAQWAIDHVTVAGGVLQLATFQDPNYLNRWVSGGVCQCSLAETYGAYFVRSRLTGPGPTQVELLWPVAGWPPEVDFNETYGGINQSMATDHYGASNSQIHGTVNVDMTKWHTWGVVWTPASLTYVLDGQVWGVVTGTTEIPSQPMTLHIQQQAWCASGWACPTSEQSTLVDWVAEYTPLAHKTLSVGPFAAGSSKITLALHAQVSSLAMQIKSEGNPKVLLVGYSDSSSRGAKDRNLGRTRVLAVASLLRKQLASLNVSGIKLSVTAVNVPVSVGGIAQTSPLPLYGKVVISLN